jgi:anthranilate/para-aminobenzoate synthase component II
VMRYHSQIAIDLPDTLKPLWFSTKQYCMAVRHTKYTIWWVQFHPESFATIDGNRIFTNFLIA